MKGILLCCCWCIAFWSKGQQIQILDSGTQTSIRGLSIVNDEVFWASGSNGKVARSTDGGKTVQWQTVQGYEGRDFRDVEAFDANTAVIMAIAEPAIILKTKDGGKTWRKVFEDSTKGMFLDAMDFRGKEGIVVGDPINGKIYKAETHNSGDSWQTMQKNNDTVVSGEAMFASSGTNVKLLYHRGFVNYFYHLIVTGGIKSEILNSGLSTSRQELSLLQGKESTGANSIAANSTPGQIIITGGDFTKDKDTSGNCVFSDDFGKTWQHPQRPPHGYRSCVEYINDSQLITCGTSGVDISNDGGSNWTLISNESFHVCQKAKKGTAVFLAGRGGRIARLIL